MEVGIFPLLLWYVSSATFDKFVLILYATTFKLPAYFALMPGCEKVNATCGPG